MHHEERRAVERMVLACERDELLVDRLVLDRVHQVIRAGAQRGLGDDELGRVHREAHPRRMRRVAGRLDDRFLRGEIVARLVDEPDLDVVGLARELARTSARASSGDVDLDDRRIAEVELRASTIEISGPATATRGAAARLSRRVAHLEVPERPADVDDARHAAREPHLERRRQPRLVARHLLRVRHDGVEVGRRRAACRGCPTGRSARAHRSGPG